MFWAAKRATTRPEDAAYCLMGLLNVNMPVLYGEGAERAFRRLQEEYIKVSDDETIFAWTADASEVQERPYWGLLAPSPRHFQNSGGYSIPRFMTHRHGRRTEITNDGLDMMLDLYPWNKDPSSTLFFSPLNCTSDANDADVFRNLFTIVLQKLSAFENQYARIRPDKVNAPAFFQWPVLNSQPHWGYSQLLVRTKPRVSDDVAGFCMARVQSVAFRIVKGYAPEFEVIPARVDIFCEGNSEESAVGPAPKAFCVFDVRSAEKTGGMSLDLQSVKGRMIVGCAKMKLVVKLGGVSAIDFMPACQSNFLYFIFGLESLPDNCFGTAAAYLKPWCVVSKTCDASALANAMAGEKATTFRVLPDGAFLRVVFGVVKYEFKMYYQMQVLNVMDK
ncbi:uncharacterized protein MAM_00245 [Metarhizium album ARSEF 1941]|uniref:Uncharacterized protein n=1 Tax=Metarhizium album (strain ARSEF 1941) TaxID=1081103 RepID=A0A0B2X4J7_METAS|nr:uncharacterized protein MAM_00245 [Metarhizium album ARSEF 1941]KHO01244.1 hypothetical protein MAM_00245 [Metarhizium album ARSEF 1941]